MPPRGRIGLPETAAGKLSGQPEYRVLIKSVEKGGLNLLEQYQVKRSITRNVEKILTVQTKDKAYKFKCNGYIVSRSKDLIKLK